MHPVYNDCLRNGENKMTSFVHVNRNKTHFPKSKGP